MVDGGRYVDENGTALDRDKKKFTMRKSLESQPDEQSQSFCPPT